MPFGFEYMEIKEADPKADEYKRVYVDVIVSNKPDGRIVPLSFVWVDGRVFIIDKVLDCRQGRSLKYHTSGCRYRCKTQDKEFYLYFTGKKWYVELKNMVR